MRPIPEISSLYLEGKNVIISKDPEKNLTTRPHPGSPTLYNPLDSDLFHHHTEHKIQQLPLIFFMPSFLKVLCHSKYLFNKCVSLGSLFGHMGLKALIVLELGK